MKKINSIEIANVDKIINGFSVKEGYLVFASNSDVVAISSGWYDRGMMYIYTYQDGEWLGNWENEFDFPVEEAYLKLEEWLRLKEFEDMEAEVEKLLADGVELYVSDEPIRFTDEVAGNKCSDGGEYGFYSTYYPTEIEGMYEYYTSTTCEFDSCGTGYEGLVILTQDKYEYFANEEKKTLLEAGLKF